MIKEKLTYKPALIITQSVRPEHTSFWVDGKCLVDDRKLPFNCSIDLLLLSLIRLLDCEYLFLLSFSSCIGMGLTSITSVHIFSKAIVLQHGLVPQIIHRKYSSINFYTVSLKCLHCILYRVLFFIIRLFQSVKNNAFLGQEEGQSDLLRQPLDFPEASTRTSNSK